MSDPTPIDVYRAPSAGVEVVRGGGRARSGFGLASIVIGVVSVVSLVGTFVLAVIWKVGGEVADADTAWMQSLWVGLLAIGACGVSLIGICLAIVSLLQADRARGAAVSGLVVNALVVLVFVLLLVIGLTTRE